VDVHNILLVHYLHSIIIEKLKEEKASWQACRVKSVFAVAEKLSCKKR